MIPSLQQQLLLLLTRPELLLRLLAGGLGWCPV
jgi:hypothetical protein